MAKIHNGLLTTTTTAKLENPMVAEEDKYSSDLRILKPFLKPE